MAYFDYLTSTINGHEAGGMSFDGDPKKGKMSATVSFALVSSAADGPLPFGEVVGIAVIFTAYLNVYVFDNYGPFIEERPHTKQMYDLYPMLNKPQDQMPVIPDKVPLGVAIGFGSLGLFDTNKDFLIFINLPAIDNTYVDTRSYYYMDY